MERGIPTWEAALERLLNDEIGTLKDELEQQALNSAFIVHGS
jgi:hypothetical protein